VYLFDNVPVVICMIPICFWQYADTTIHLNSIFHQKVLDVQIVSYLTDNTVVIADTDSDKTISHMLWIVYTINVYIYESIYQHMNT